MRILVVRYETIGDTIFATAFLRNLKKNFSNAQIDLVGDNLSKELLCNCPYIDNIYCEKDISRNPVKYYAVFAQYDRVYLLKNSRFFSIYSFLCGIKKRYGFRVKKVKFLTNSVPYNEDRQEIECYLDLLRADKISVDNSQTELWDTPEKDEKIKDYIAKLTDDVALKTAVVHMHSRVKKKNWPEANWAQVIKFLSNEMNCRVFLTGAKKDIVKCENFCSNLDDNIKLKPINIAGQLDLSEFKALIKKTDITLSVDTGAIHIAAAYQKDSILIHGPTSLKRWIPQNPNCRIVTLDYTCSPCVFQTDSVKLCKREKPRCLLELTPDIVIKEISLIFHKAQNQILCAVV